MTPAHAGLRARGNLLACVIGGVTLLSALCLAGAWSAATLGNAWRGEAAATLTVLVPDGADVAAVLALLRADPDTTAATPLPDAEVSRLLAPFAPRGLPLPEVIEVTLDATAIAEAAAARMTAAAAATAPGTAVEAPSEWRARIRALGRLIAAAAVAAAALVIALAAAVTVLATRGVLAERWDGIVILHGLGATDAQVADAVAAELFRTAARGMAGGLGLIVVTMMVARLAVQGVPWTAWTGLGVAAMVLGVGITGLARLSAWATARARLRLLR